MLNKPIQNGSEIYSPFHSNTVADPFPVFRKLQNEAPVVWHDGFFAWVVSRYDDCKRILGTSSSFVRDPAKLLGIGDINPNNLTIQEHDPPEPLLQILRQELVYAMGNVNLQDICREAGEVFSQCLVNQPNNRSFDFMPNVAAPTALTFACRLIGVSEVLVETYEPIFIRITRAMDSSLNEELHKPGVDATKELQRIITEAQSLPIPGSVIYELNKNPLVKELPAGYVSNTISAMFNAAYSTAYTSMGSFLALSFERPGLAQQIVDSGEINKGVNELLRFTSPAQLTMRYCSQDTTISGVKISKKDRLITLMGAANRDPARFNRPDDLILNRSPNPHLSFGWGAHFCIGAAPAKMFLESYVQLLAHWEPKLKLAGELSWLDTATLRCLKHLPVLRLAHNSRVR